MTTVVLQAKPFTVRLFCTLLWRHHTKYNCHSATKATTATTKSTAIEEKKMNYRIKLFIFFLSRNDGKSNGINMWLPKQFCPEKKLIGALFIFSIQNGTNNIRCLKWSNFHWNCFPKTTNSSAMSWKEDIETVWKHLYLNTIASINASELYEWMVR